MKTVFLLMAQYDARAVIPIDWVARDFFSHLTIDNLVRKVSAGGRLAIAEARASYSRQQSKITSHRRSLAKIEHVASVVG